MKAAFLTKYFSLLLRWLVGVSSEVGRVKRSATEAEKNKKSQTKPCLSGLEKLREFAQFFHFFPYFYIVISFKHSQFIYSDCLVYLYHSDFNSFVTVSVYILDIFFMRGKISIHIVYLINGLVNCFWKNRYTSHVICKKFSKITYYKFCFDENWFWHFY